MPQNDLWAAFRTSPAQQAPVASPMVALPSSKISKLKTQKAEQDIVHQANQDQRSAEQLNLERERLRIAQAEEEAKRKARELSGGVDTTEGERVAAFLTTQLANHAKVIEETRKKHPDAISPGWTETIADATGSQILKNLAIPEETKSARQILNNRYAMATEAVLTLGTGAAYTPDQKAERVRAYAPQVTDTEETKADKARMLREDIIASKVKAGAAAGNIDTALAEVDKLFGAGGTEQKPHSGVAPGQADGKPVTHTLDDIVPDIGLKESDSKRFHEAPSAMSQEHANWIRQHPGASAADYINFRKELDQRYITEGQVPNYISGGGYDGKEAEIQAFLDYYKGQPNADVPAIGWEEGMGDAEKFIQDHVLPNGAFGAGITAAANSLAGGVPELLVGEEGRKNLHRATEAHPYAAVAGDIAGTIAPSGAMGQLEKGAGKLAMKWLGREAPVASSVAANVVYGGMRGANSAEEGDRLEAAAGGAALSGLGAAGGQTFVKGAPAFLAEDTNKALETLKGVKDKTLFQSMGLGQVEESLQQLPLVRRARQKSMESMNIDKVNKTLQPFGLKLGKNVKAGPEANTKLNDYLNQEYNNIRPKLNGTIDATFANRVAGLRVAKAGQNASKLERELFGEIDKSLALMKNGKYDGASFKDIDQRLRNLSHDWAGVEASDNVINPSTYHDMARVAELVRQQLRAQASRNTPEVAGTLKKLDKAWAQSKQIEDATNRALATSQGVYSPSQLLTTIKKLDRSKGKGASARGKALDQDYAMAAQDILGSAPSKETSSLMQTLAMVYMGANHPLAALPVAGAGTLAYTPGINKIAKFLAAGQRPEALQNSKLPQVLAEVLRLKGQGLE